MVDCLMLRHGQEQSPSRPRMFEDLQFSDDAGPVYRQLAAAIATRIQAGALAVGDRLPPQRDIARALGINVTTVTRALATLQERGLLEARAGRGTLVAAKDASDKSNFVSSPSDKSGVIDLSVNRPATMSPGAGSVAPSASLTAAPPSVSMLRLLAPPVPLTSGFQCRIMPVV